MANSRGVKFSYFITLFISDIFEPLFQCPLNIPEAFYWPV